MAAPRRAEQRFQSRVRQRQLTGGVDAVLAGRYSPAGTQFQNLALVSSREGTTAASVKADGTEEVSALYPSRNAFGGLEGASGTGSATNTETGFTGASTPNQTGGFTYLRNRWYDPQTGRFLTQDPIGLAGGVNLYAYAGNNPVAFSDPYGFSKCIRKAVLLCALVEFANDAMSFGSRVTKRIPDMLNAPGRTAGEVSEGVANDLKKSQRFSVHNPPTGSGHNPPTSGASEPPRGTSLDTGLEFVSSALPIIALAGGVTAVIAEVVMTIQDLLPGAGLGTNPVTCRVEHCDGTQELPAGPE